MDGSGARDRLIFALDAPALDDARVLAAKLAADVGVIKVGLELFTEAGPEAVRAVHALGRPSFLDLKLHDIPETVGRAASAAARLGVRYLTVHAAAGRACLERAAEAGRGPEPTLLATPVLRSLDDADLAAIGLAGPAPDAALRLGKLAIDAGIGGLVCSAAEVRKLRDAVGRGPVLVTPGIRPRGTAHGDQRRVATAAEAIAAGADLIVVGRPLRDAPDPAAAARAMVAEIEGALAERAGA